MRIACSVTNIGSFRRRAVAKRVRGLKTVEDKSAIAHTTLMNKMGAEGWEYQRADALPCDERVEADRFQDHLLSEPSGALRSRGSSRGRQRVSSDHASLAAPDCQLEPEPAPTAALTATPMTRQNN